MKDPADPASSRATSVPAALLEYFEAPGKYQLTLRQPALLFSSVREILQLASGRGPADAPQSSRLREAANFFIRAALLYPGADHYAALGLAPGESATDLKERYRLLMRLIHPDFAQGGAATWPADAAVRVNRAYEVLSSPVLRRDYDDQLAAPRTQRQATPKGPAFYAPPPRRPEEAPRRFGKKAALVFGLSVGIPAVLLLLPRSEPEHLVQRSIAPATAQRAAETTLAEQRVPALVGAERLAPAAPAPALAAPVIPQATAPSPPARVASVAAPPAQPPVAHAAAPVVRPEARPAAPVLAARAPVAPPLVVAAANNAPPVVAARVPEPVPRRFAEEPAAAMPLPTNVAAAPVLASVAAIPTPVAAPVPAPVAAPLPAPVAAAVVAAPIAVAKPAPPPVPTLADAQPLLTQVLQMLESGSGDQLLRLLDGDARKQPGAQALSRRFEQMVHGSRPVRLTQVEFAGEPRDGGVLLVTGRIRLHAGEPTIGSYGERLVVKAEFVQRGGKVQLTGLSGPD